MELLRTFLTSIFKLLSYFEAVSHWFLQRMRNKSDMELELKGSNVMVTGASKGIGEELAYEYARYGANLVLTARSHDLLEKVTNQCRKFGATDVCIISADMSKPEDVNRVYEGAMEHFDSKIDTLVLNHAFQVKPVGWNGSEEQMSILRNMHEINFMSYVHLASQTLKSMIDRNSGRIVVITSVLGKMAIPNMAPYCSTKFALQGFFGSLQHELRHKTPDISITLGVLGRIAVPPSAPTKDTAEAIIYSSYLRKAEFVFPSHNRIGIIAKELPLLSTLIDLTIGWMFRKH